ncbi:hypothetical protein [Thermus aquaticus]|jgi:hypothetical protein|uniref:Uncharacterized protein n=1 Tax=Thermus aquaticus (strain ATCC BAA-2747 / Y51MC23) TaxID=498848 RepID=A0ABM5VKH7_THEA5|nr:hypothetical protein [Thermus aquaticus]ALJ90666.1 hypothetical protein TO73_0818 [Thermus aquaticus Y51MC23]
MNEEKELKPFYRVEEFKDLMGFSYNQALAVARVFGFRFGKNYLIPRPVVARFLAGEVSREEGERIAHELSVINAESERKASRGRR